MPELSGVIRNRGVNHPELVQEPVARTEVRESNTTSPMMLSSIVSSIGRVMDSDATDRGLRSMFGGVVGALLAPSVNEGINSPLNPETAIMAGAVVGGLIHNRMMSSESSPSIPRFPENYDSIESEQNKSEFRGDRCTISLAELDDIDDPVAVDGYVYSFSQLQQWVEHGDTDHGGAGRGTLPHNRQPAADATLYKLVDQLADPSQSV